MQEGNLKILIVDDDPNYRLFLFNTLKEWGHDVTTASDGLEALNLIKKEHIQLVISDWMMPEMDGIKLCKEIRNWEKDIYTYFILLTAKSDKPDFIEGMRAGTDDYLTKSFEVDELEVCLRAGIRILNIQNAQKDKYEILETANEGLKGDYNVIKDDLSAAAILQKNLLPKPGLINNVNFQWMFKPASFLAGDIFNYFQLDEENMAFYLIDVSGHGVPAALLSVSLQQIISPLAEQNGPSALNKEKFLNPAEVLHDLNHRFQMKIDDQQFFTMIYGVVNPKSKTLKFSIAGHPLPFVQNSHDLLSIGKGATPIGWVPKPDYEEYEIPFNQGDRIFIYSDGVTDCLFNSKLSLESLIKNSREWSLKKLMGVLRKKSNEVEGSGKISDDISFLALEIN